MKELNLQLKDHVAVKERLAKADQSLRDEILAGEEQRTYIDMLKQQVETKICQAGLNFGHLKPIDGFMQLCDVEQASAALQAENAALNLQAQD